MHAHELAQPPSSEPPPETENRPAEPPQPDPPPPPERPTFLTVLLRALGTWPT